MGSSYVPGNTIHNVNIKVESLKVELPKVKSLKVESPKVKSLKVESNKVHHQAVT